MNIIIKRYEGYNSALGKYIKSRKHYEEEMSKGGYVPFDKTNPVSKEKKWIPSEELKKKLYNLKQMGNKKGEIQVSSGYVNMLNDSGVKTQLPDWCPQHYKEGSFSK